jgi:hypothetical protein
MDAARRRLLAVGDNRNSEYFLPRYLGDFLGLARNSMGDTLLYTLLRQENDLIKGVCSVCKEMQRFRADAAMAPSKAMGRLANGIASLVAAFHHKVSSVYAGDWIHSLGPMLLVECTAALGGAATTPAALLTIYALKRGQAPDLDAFVAGTLPPKEHVAIAQTIVQA